MLISIFVRWVPKKYMLKLLMYKMQVLNTKKQMMLQKNFQSIKNYNYKVDYPENLYLKV